MPSTNYFCIQFVIRGPAAARNYFSASLHFKVGRLGFTSTSSRFEGWWRPPPTAVSCEPIETDLGEYIIQLRREAPSHIIAPAIHVLKHQVAEAFYETHDQFDPERPLEEPRALLDEAREVLRQKFIDADVGITKDLLRFPDDLHLLLGVAIVLERVDVGDHIEGKRV